MITKEQIQAAEQGKPVDLRIDETDFVLIRRDAYDRFRQLLPYEDLDPEEMADAILEAWGDDPGLDPYQEYK